MLSQDTYGWEMGSRDRTISRSPRSISLLPTVSKRPCLKNSGKAGTNMWGLSFNHHVCTSFTCEHTEDNLISQAFLSKYPLHLDLTLVQPDFWNNVPRSFPVHSSATSSKGVQNSFHTCSFGFFWLHQKLFVFIGWIFHIRQESQAHNSRIINFILEKHFSLNDLVNINFKKTKEFPWLHLNI